MRVGIDARAAKWYRGTGIGTYTYELINSLNNIDKTNYYKLYSSLNSISSNALDAKVPICFWDEIKIPNNIKDENLDLYHVPQNGIGLPKDKTCPFIITLHDVIPLKMPETVSNNYLKIFNELLPKILPLCDGILTVSEHSNRDIQQAFNYPKNKIYVTYLAAEDIFKPIDKNYSKEIIRKKYSIPDDFILYVGGFSPRKNIIGLIEAYSLLPSTIKEETKLIIAGNKGISYELYKNRVETLNLTQNVIFPGFIPINDLPLFYNAASVFVYPSLYEGFGLPPLESMACGTPVITSNLTSMLELFNDTCIMIDPYNLESIRDAILLLLSDHYLRKSMIKNGIEKSSCFSFDKTAKSTIAAYDNIIKR